MNRLFLSTFRQLLLLLACVCAFGTLARAANPWPASSYLYKQHGTPGAAVNYRLFVPLNYNAANADKHPVVVFAHGDGELEGGFVFGNPNVYNSKQMGDNGQYSFVTTANQAQFPCFLMLVQRSNSGNLATNIYNAVNALGNEYKTAGGQSKVDLDRLIITGLSGGGGVTVEGAATHPNFYAAAVPLSLALPGGFVAANMVDVPSWFFMAKNDSFLGNSDSTVNALRALGAHPIYTVYDTGGHSGSTWTAAYATPALIPWLAAQRASLAQNSDPAVLTITSPTSGPSFAGTSAAVTISGTTTKWAGADPLISQVRYGRGGYSGNGNYSIAATGTSSWTFSDTLKRDDVYTFNPFKFYVVAIGTSWSANLGGVTQYSDNIVVTKPKTDQIGDWTNPTVSLLTPTTGAPYTSTTAAVTVTGAATDNYGVSHVTWSNSLGGNGYATGATSWSAAIPLLVGNNVLTIRSWDIVGRSATTSLTVTYSGYVPPPAQILRYDFGLSSNPTTLNGWNNVTDLVAGAVANSVDTSNAFTGIGLAITQPFGASSNGGATTGIYPGSAMQDTFYTYAAQTARLRLTGLNPANTYKFTFFSSRAVVASDRVARYTIGAATTTLDAAAGGGNTATTATLTGITPTAAGVIEIDCSTNAGSQFGYLGVVEVERE